MSRSQHAVVTAVITGALAAVVSAGGAQAATPSIDILRQSQITITGFAPGESEAPVISPAGDVNGDGRADMFVGDPNFGDTGGPFDGVSGPGRAFIVYGTAGPTSVDLRDIGTRGRPLPLGAGEAARTLLIDLDGDGRRDAVTLLVSATGGFGTKVRYQSPDGGFGDRGFSVAGVTYAGTADLDGDGRPELLLNRLLAGDLKEEVENLLLPGARAWTGDLTVGQLKAQGGVVIDTPEAPFDSDLALTEAGDVNGDGRRDAAFRITPSGAEPRPSYHVFSSRAGRSLSTLDPAAPGAGGSSVIGIGGWPVGDINGDGRDDAVGQRPAMDQVVVFGTSSPTVIDAADLGARGFLLPGAVSVNAVGDVNADGRADLAVERAAGAILFGQTTPPYVVDGVLLAHPQWSLRESGTLGDVNGDGVGDVVFSLRRSTNAGFEPQVKVMFGGASFVPDVTPPALSVRLSPTVFRVGSLPRWVPKGSRLLVTLGERATMSVSVRDVLTRPVASASFANVNAGSAEIPFDGTVGRTRLGPGVYTASVVARDAAGNASPAKRVSFTIVG